jgi:hypothetical protein
MIPEPEFKNLILTRPKKKDRTRGSSLVAVNAKDGKTVAIW